MHSKKVIDKAKKLKREGFSYRDIAAEIGVSLSTVSRWCQDIKIQHSEVTKSRIKKARAAAKTTRVTNTESRRSRTRLAVKEALGGLTRRDLMMLGIAIYMGEGSKTKHVIRVTNSNPLILKLAKRWFRESLGVPNINFKIYVHIHPDMNQSEIVKYWSDLLNVPIDQFGRVSVDSRKKRKVGFNSDYMGTVQLTIVGKGNKDYSESLRFKIEDMMKTVYNQL